VWPGGTWHLGKDIGLLWDLMGLNDLMGGFDLMWFNMV
jgi:hypothetical protein